MLLVSNRGLSLVTQVAEVTMLTVEDYLKWYTYFIIEPSSNKPNVLTLWEFVESLNNRDVYNKVENVLLDEERDHCITPRGFVKLAEIINLRFDFKTYLAVINMFNENVCEFGYCINEDGLSKITTKDEYYKFICMIDNYCCDEDRIKKICIDWPY